MDGGSWFATATIAAFAGVFVLSAIAAAWNGSLRRAETLRRAGDALGLPVARDRFVRKLRGSIGGLELRIRRGREGGDHGDVLLYEVSAPQLSAMEIGRQTVGAMLRRAIGGATVETGDVGFDRDVVVRGYDVEVLALLDEKTRESVRKLVVDHRFELRGRTLTMTTRGDLDSDTIVAYAQLLLHVASRLENRNPLDALAHAVLHERFPDVRRRCLDVFLRRSTAGPRRDEVLVALLGDPDPRLRLIGAKTLATPAAAAALRELSVAPALTPDLRGEALEAALRLLPVEEAAELLDGAVSQREAPLLAAALRVAATGRVRLDVEWMIRNLAHADDALVALACAAVAASGDSHAEPWLLARLRYGGDVRRAAIHGLGEIGTVAAVAPLHDVGGSDAEAAIARIQARVEGGGTGQLSIAESRGGAVSLTDRDSGSLSIVVKKKQTT